MKEKKFIFIMLFLFVSLFCYSSESSNHNGIESNSGIEAYRKKYASALKHFSSKKSDSLRYKACLFLIDNMDGHMSPEGKQMDTFKNMISSFETKKSMGELHAAWNYAGKSGTTEFVPDSAVVTNQMLISNVNSAFDAWQTAKWKDEISFEQFCSYILPYRCGNEHIGGNWRKVLRDRYYDLIKDEKNMARAFAILKDSVFKDVVLSNVYCPYSLDAISSLIIGRAPCGQQYMLLVNVLRALGIPAALDNTPMWADYSQKSHGWATMIGRNGEAYTVFEKDTVAKTKNPVDAAVFVPRYRVQESDSCPYLIKQIKTAIKVYRDEYKVINKDARNEPQFLSNVFLRDVSKDYGLNTSISFEIQDRKRVYLSAYSSAKDWIPVTWADSKDGKVTFDNVGKGSVCVPYIMENGKRKFLTEPVLVGENGIIKKFVTDPSVKETIRINRKYPLCQNIVDVWGAMRGGLFLGANNADFSDADTIGFIKNMPSGITYIDCQTKKEYRYFRYKATQKNRSSLSELQFLKSGQNGLEVLNGNYYADGIDDANLDKLRDDNMATYCKGLAVGYSVTLDLGEGNTSCVSKIKFSPSTDLNFVEKGHFYELYYFDREWHLISRKAAKEEYLVFENVPVGALLLLKDRTEGVDERIFVYNKGQQIWY